MSMSELEGGEFSPIPEDRDRCNGKTGFLQASACCRRLALSGRKSKITVRSGRGRKLNTSRPGLMDIAWFWTRWVLKMTLLRSNKHKLHQAKDSHVMCGVYGERLAETEGGLR